MDFITKEGLVTYQTDICPYCSRKLINQYCVYKCCKGKRVKQIHHYCQTLNIDISENLISILVYKYIVNSIPQLYKLNRTKLKNLGVGKQRINRFMSTIDNKLITLEQVLIALNIAKTDTAPSIAEYCNGDIYTFIYYAKTNHDWSDLKNVGKITSDNINKQAKEQNKLLEFMHHNFYIRTYNQEDDNVPLYSKFVYVSGEFSRGRNYICKLISNNGGKVIGDYKYADIIVCNSQFKNKTVMSDKTVMSEDELIELVEGK